MGLFMTLIVVSASRMLMSKVIIEDVQLLVHQLMSAQLLRKMAASLADNKTPSLLEIAS